MIPKNVVTWLVESEDPSVRYRTLVELLGRSLADFDVQECKNQITASLPVKMLLGKMRPDGYWLQKNPRTGKLLGTKLRMEPMEPLIIVSPTWLNSEWIEAIRR